MKQLPLTGIAALFLSTSAFAEPILSNQTVVLDGDTIRIHDKYPNVRLVGFNTPETRNASCPAEAELGARATRRLRELVRAGGLEFEYVRCSCPPHDRKLSTNLYSVSAGVRRIGEELSSAAQSRFWA